MIFNNNGKNPNELHKFLIENGCAPILLAHNAVYDDAGGKTQEATVIDIEVEPEKESMLGELVNQFMNSVD